MKIFQAVLWKLIGKKYERLWKNGVFFVILYGVLRYCDIQFPISFPILTLIILVYSFGVILQVLYSEVGASNLTGQFILPFSRVRFNLQYFAGIIIYTLATKTGLFFILYIGACQWNLLQFLCLLLSFVQSCAAGFCFYLFTRQKYLVRAVILVLIQALMVLFSNFTSIVMAAEAFLFIALFLYIAYSDSYLFYHTGPEGRAKQYAGRIKKILPVYFYLFRYMTARKSYLFNTIIMWVFACVFAVMLGKTGFAGFMPLGFAILSLNTPIGILLSGDRDFRMKVQSLPDQNVLVFLPYRVVICLSNILSYLIYCLCWRITNGPFHGTILILALLFAWESAAIYVFLEWKFPVVNWKVESDLWHHPRKYIVPASMTGIAVLIVSQPWTSLLLLILIIVQEAFVVSAVFGKHN
ncbi:hypothetical protein QA584_25800 [Anaerocolumna sp. AGMB13025]|uniref:hypothetical protein n=1 Tax=Anaerocolumna sp. AGMB13025 TaxID=3039116 RepID=UPI00241CFFC1|nr:hypothetical protein [Anaerocolumna sp. AGMB13025]WFR56989.1 hypothetical protein QA584_25800 [Anaerocolumna sp. AGMB13025]